MKCIASFFLLAINFIVTAFARKELGRPNIGGFYFACYDDGRATLTGMYGNRKLDSYKIPATVTYEGKSYRVTIIRANVFNGGEIPRISVDPNNTALLLKRDSFKGISKFKQFDFDSPYTEPEIGAFPIRTTIFGGNYIPNALDKIVKTYLKKWKLPYQRDYSTVSETQKMMDLYNLAQKMHENFNIYLSNGQQRLPHSVAFTSSGGREGIARLFRIMAMAMGIPEKQVLVGCEADAQYAYCWNYVKLSINTTEKKWYVIPVKSDSFLSPFSTSLFQTEYYFTTKGDFIKSHGSNYIYLFDAHDFIVYNDVYLTNDNRTGPRLETFDSWLERMGGGKRTLNRND